MFQGTSVHFGHIFRQPPSGKSPSPSSILILRISLLFIPVSSPMGRISFPSHTFHADIQNPSSSQTRTFILSQTFDPTKASSGVPSLPRVFSTSICNPSEPQRHERLPPDRPVYDDIAGHLILYLQVLLF